MRLAAIPGLNFLQTYVVSARGMKTRFGQRKGDYEAYLAAGQDAVGDVREASGKPRSRNSGQDEDFEEEYEYDYDYDDYDEEVDDFSGKRLGPSDDYPRSDDYHSYFDDDYGS